MTGNKEVLIFGLGNPLYGDDGVGHAVIQRLAGDFMLPGTVRLLESGSLSDLLDFVNEVDLVIVVDAMHMGRMAGELAVFDLDALAPTHGAVHHSPGILDYLKSVRSRAEVFFVCIEPGDLSLGSGFTPSVSMKIPDIIALILKRLREFGVPVCSSERGLESSVARRDEGQDCR